jgi:hypothetical protein
MDKQTEIYIRLKKSFQERLQAYVDRTDKAGKGDVLMAFADCLISATAEELARED